MRHNHHFNIGLPHMKKLTIALSVALALVATTPVYASNASFPGKGEICHERSHDDACRNSHKAAKHAPHKVPEINAGSAGLALALIGGILTIRRERRTKRQA